MAFGGGFGYPSLGGYYGAVGGLAQIGASSSSVVYVDPGTSCSGTSVRILLRIALELHQKMINQQMCGGGSYCFQSTCSCPTGQIVVGTSCVAQTAGILSPFAGGVTGCPTGLVSSIQASLKAQKVKLVSGFDRCSLAPPASLRLSFNLCQPITCAQAVVPVAQLVLTAYVHVPEVFAILFLFFRVATINGNFVGMSWTNGVCSTMQTTSIGSFGLGSAALLGPSIFSGPSVVNYPGLPYGSSFTSTSVVALGSPCLQTSQCGSGSWCHVGVCSCQASFVQMGTTCVRRSEFSFMRPTELSSNSISCRKS